MTFVLVYTALLCLIWGAALSLRYARRREETRTRSAWFLNMAALGLLLADFAWTSVRQGEIALNTMGDSMLFFAVILLTVVNIASRVTGSHVISLMLAPVCILLALGSTVADRWFSTGPARLMVNSSFLTIHVLLFVLSYALFCLAAGFATLFLFQHGILKTKNYSPLFFKLPGLMVLDRYAGRSALWGLGLLTVAIAMAFSSFYRLREQGQGPEAQRLVCDATVLASMILWLYYSAFAVLRLVIGWKGRRSSFMVVMGFAILIVLYFAAKAMPGGMLHGYRGSTVVVRG